MSKRVVFEMESYHKDALLEMVTNDLDLELERIESIGLDYDDIYPIGAKIECLYLLGEKMEAKKYRQAVLSHCNSGCKDEFRNECNLKEMKNLITNKELKL